MTGTNLPGARPPAAGGKRALLIGIDAYEAVTPLRGCVNDILAIRGFLTSQLGLGAEAIQFLAAPRADSPLPADVVVTAAPNRANILAALDRLAQETQAGDEVVIYYSGHGVRIGSGPGTLIPNPTNRNQHFSAIAAVDTRLTGLNLVLARELNAGITRLLAKNVTVTAVFDACHSGGVATRDLAAPDADAPAVREIVLDPAEIDWDGFMQQYQLRGAPPEAETRDIGADGSGWAPTLDQTKELIVVSGCRDVELSHEYTPAGTRQGALTYFLLDALRSTDAAQIGGLRWMDIYPGVRGNVNSRFPDQTPTLEGRRERPVFGGAWQPYAPGFSVTRGAGGQITLNGGSIHGLGKGAQVRIYPPGTADFTAAARQAAAVIAEVDSATSVLSQAHVISGDANAVQDGGRALVIKPSVGTPPLGVVLTDVPAPLAASIRGAAGANSFLTFVSTVADAGVEVRAWTRKGQRGWAILKARVPNSANPVGENDVIAFAPGEAAAAAEIADLGGRLAAGLVQWARYRAILNRRNDEPKLKGAVTLTLLAEADRDHLINRWDQADAPVCVPSAAGEVAVTTGERMLLKLNIGETAPSLNVVILLCSDEGNIQLLFDTSDNPLPGGEERSVGLGGPLRPFRLGVSDWQTASRYTFKVFASDKDHPFDAQSLTLDSTVQDLLTGGTRAVAQADEPDDVLWTTFELPVVITAG